MGIEIDQLKEKFTLWLKRQNLSDRTIKEYLYYFNKANIQTFNQKTVNNFFDIKGNRNSMGKGFMKQYMQFLKINYEELGITSEERVKIMEVDIPKPPKNQRKEIRMLTIEDIKLLEDAFDDEIDKLILLISFYGALRIQEVMAITRHSFDYRAWNNNPHKYGLLYIRKTKGNKQRKVPLPPFLLERLRNFIINNSHRYTQSDEFLFSNKNATKQHRGNAWAKRLKKAGIKAGLIQLDENGQMIPETSIHPHSLRHLGANYLYNEKGFKEMEIKEFLGHSSISTTQLYLHIDKDSLQEKLSKSDPAYYQIGENKANVGDIFDIISQSNPIIEKVIEMPPITPKIEEVIEQLPLIEEKEELYEAVDEDDQEDDEEEDNISIEKAKTIIKRKTRQKSTLIKRKF